MSRTAYFVRSPRRLEDLRKPHRCEKEQPYTICKTLYLNNITFENFATDLRADRVFIEANAHLCKEAAIWHCLLVRNRTTTDGILVLPERGAHVKWAAYVQVDG